MGDKPKVPTGEVTTTNAVYSKMVTDRDFNEWAHQCLRRHQTGDWGILSAEDRQANDLALKRGERLLSSYKDDRFPGQQIWIITEPDRSQTTVMFPDEPPG